MQLEEKRNKHTVCFKGTDPFYHAREFKLVAVKRMLQKEGGHETVCGHGRYQLSLRRLAVFC